MKPIFKGKYTLLVPLRKNNTYRLDLSSGCRGRSTLWSPPTRVEAEQLPLPVADGITLCRRIRLI
jgi:hypothetical protein